MARIKNTFINSQVKLFLTLFLLISVFAGVYAVIGFILPRSQAKVRPVFGKAIELSYDPANLSYIEVGQSQDLNAKKDFTVEAWIKPSQVILNSYLFSKSNGSENGYNLSLYTNQISENIYAIVYTFSVADANLSYHAMRTVMMQYEYTAEQITSWHHVAGVIQTDGKMDIFVDGERSTMNSNTINNIWNNSLSVTVGARKLNLTDVDGHFPGQIDEVRVSSISRYPGNFVPQETPFIQDANTQLLYHFDGDSVDSSGNGRNGVTYGVVRYVDSTVVSFEKVKPTKKPNPSRNP